VRLRVLVTGLISFSLIALPSTSQAIQAGDSCKKVGSVKKFGSKTYTCVKKGKKSFWRLQKSTAQAAAPIPTPTPTPSPSPTAAQPTSDVAFKDNYQNFISDLESCRLKETGNLTGAGPKGFPMRSKVPHQGEVKIAIIPIDFPNAPGIGNPKEMYRDDIQTMKEWSQFFSSGKMIYKPELVSNEWLRAPKGAEWYVCVECQKGATSAKQSMDIAFNELIALADKNYDFSNTKFVYFAFPLAAESKYGTSMYFHRISMTTNEGEFIVSVYGEMGGSTDTYGRDRAQIWNHVIHELLHFQGFIGHGPFFGQGIMSDEFGPSQAVTSWEAFLADWFAENQIACLEKSRIKEPIFITMDSLDTLGVKPISSMIKLNDEELIVIERRGNGKYSDFSKADNWEGIFLNLDHFTAYRVNVNDVYGRVDWRDLESKNPNFWKYIREGREIKISNSVLYQGVKIEVLNKNQIKISVVN
jgi:hypothetical protein